MHLIVKSNDDFKQPLKIPLNKLPVTQRWADAHQKKDIISML